MHIFVAHPFPSLELSAPEPSKMEGCWLALRRCVGARCVRSSNVSISLSVLCLVVALSDCILSRYLGLTVGHN